MDIMKLIGMAEKLGLPTVVSDIVGAVTAVKDNAARAKHVLSDGDQAELDAIHAEALAANTALDAKLAAAAQR